jgi:hypothetical protein
VRHPLPRAVEEAPFASIRAACAAVAERARSVRIRADRIEVYAATVPVEEVRTHPGAVNAAGTDPEERAAFVVLLDATNFGSGWFPRLKKRPGLSGYGTVEASLREWWEQAGAPSVEALRRADPDRMSEIFGQSGTDPEVGELMGLFARSWRDLGDFVEREHGGDLLGPLRGAKGSAAELVRRLCRMPLYRDLARHEGAVVPFLKRAQITVHDLALTVEGPLGRFADLEELTLFADNLVPHVLRLDGLLEISSDLELRIEREELIASGSPEEVELRACAVHAVERLVETMNASGARTSARGLDQFLWSRGQGERYKARPRHRTRCPYY